MLVTIKTDTKEGNSMQIWITRHGQTKYNKDKRMQGLTDEPLNEVGIQQAYQTKEKINVQFDAVYASPLKRAIQTASIISGYKEKDIQTDPRIIEVDFGKYELKKYYLLGLKMTAYWALPEVFPRPKSVESIDSMNQRSHSFLKELESKNYENVLIVCHGGIIRSLCGYLSDQKNGVLWRPKPHNCEIRVYRSEKGKHSFIQQI